MPTYVEITWEDILADTRQLANRLMGRSWSRIVAVTRGGLIPAALLARALDVVVIDTVCIGSYRGESRGEEKVYKSPDFISEGGRDWLVVDDLVDSGKTARIVKENWFPQATLVTLYAKPEGEPYADAFVRSFPQDTWLVFPWEMNER